MTDEASVARVAEAVMSGGRYRDVDADAVRRIAAEELPRAHSQADAVKRVKRRLHQAVGAYRSARRGGRDQLGPIRQAWRGDLEAPAFRDACRSVLENHASTRERLPHLVEFYAGIWRGTGGPPASLLDLGCGFGPLALPWMQLPRTARYHAIDVDRAQLAIVDGFLDLIGQPHDTQAVDLAALSPSGAADVALLLKLVPILDRQDPAAAARLLRELRVRHAVVSFPARSLGGRAKGMERTYRQRMETLARDLGERLIAVAEASVPNELVFVLSLRTGVSG